VLPKRDPPRFWEQYLRTPADAENPLAVPAKAESLEGLPPTLVLTTEYEVARDDAEAYGEQLAAAGVDTDDVRFPGLIHGVFWMSRAVSRSRSCTTRSSPSSPSAWPSEPRSRNHPRGMRTSRLHA
jgi:acetyl esterase/lipase